MLFRDLTACGCAPLLKGLQTFPWPLRLLASPAQKNPLPLKAAVATWLNRQTDSALWAIADEFISRPDLTGSEDLFLQNHPDYSSSGLLCFKRALPEAEGVFALGLFRELSHKDFPALASHFPLFKKRLDSLLDMRFYGSSLETLLSETCRYEQAAEITVDWARTSSAELWLEIPSATILSHRLNPEAQTNLFHLVIQLLLERQVFISSFRGVLVDSLNRVNLPDFDDLYPFDSALLHFLQNYLLGKSIPSAPLQYKLLHLIKLLQVYCPDINIQSELNDALDGLLFTDSAQDSSSVEMLALYARHRMNLKPLENITPPNPASLAYLLDKTRFKKDPIFRKSSILYYGPLLILIYILLKYFS